MLTKIDRKFLKEKKACKRVYNWWRKNCQGLDNINQIKKLAEHRFEWANWLIVRVMTYKQYVSYAVFAAEQVIDNPEDKKPKEAIEAAKKCIDNPSEENKAVAATAYDVASYYDVAYAAAYAAAYATDDVAAYPATATARINLQKKIINYGIDLLTKSGTITTEIPTEI